MARKDSHPYRTSGGQLSPNRVTFPGPRSGRGSQTCSERNVVLRVSKDEPEAAATADLSAETGDPEGVRWAVPSPPLPPDPNAGGIPMLGELLIESQLIASSQLDEALLQQSASGKRLGELLVELGAIDDFDLARVLATRLNLPLADLRQSTPEDDAIALVPEAMARANVAIPVRRTDEGLQVAMAFPQDAAAVDQMRGSAGLAVVPMIAPPSDIRRAIDKSYRALAGVSRHVDAFLAAEAITARTVTESDAGIDAPVVQVVNLIITQGVRDRASDIHIEPQDARVRVRYRIDGALHDVLALPANMGAGRRQPHQDPGRDEHRRAAPAAGRPDRDGGRRPPARHPRRHHRDDLGREGRDAAARQEPLALPSGRPRHARRRPTIGSHD